MEVPFYLIKIFSFCGYCHERKQRVNINGVGYGLKIVRCGSFFLIYISDVFELSLNGSPYCSADDMSLIYVASSHAEHVSPK